MTAALTFALVLGLLAKTSLLAGAGLAAARWIARRPSDRVEVLRATTVLLLALPLLAAFAPALRLDVLPGLAPETASAEPLWAGTAGPVAGVAISGAILWPSPVVILAWVWALGAAAILARLLVGLCLLRRWTALAEPVRCPAWKAALDDLRPGRRPALLSSSSVGGPLSWGLPPGAILIDRASLSTPEAAPAILAHEMAHVRRCDWLFLMLSRLMLAVFWFNPLVWKLHADLSAASEDAADAEAVRHVDPGLYARALINLASDTTAHNSVALAMAADPQALKRRISRVMNQPAFRTRPWAIGLTLAGLVAIATPLAALELHTAPTPPAPPAAPVLPAPDSPPRAPQPPAAPLPVAAALQAGAPPAPPDWPERLPPAAPPAPPVPPAHDGFAVPPAPPAPPAPPRHRQVVVIENGVTRDATPEEEAAAERARGLATTARLQADEARNQALGARRQAEAARQQGERSGAMAAQARGQAVRARHDAQNQRLVATAQMREGAVQMRREGARYSDPAYRAKAIAEARVHGRTVTDAQLQAIGPRLMAQADRLEDRASGLAERGAD